MHPQAPTTRLPRWGPRCWLRCSSFKYSRYCHPTAQTTRGGGPGSRSSRLAIVAPRPSRCDARLSPRAARNGQMLARLREHSCAVKSVLEVAQPLRACEEMRRLTAQHASFDKLRMSAHGEPVEPCGLRGLG